MNRSVSFDRVEIIEEKSKSIGKVHSSQSSGDLRDAKVHRHFVKIDFYETCRDIKEIRTKLDINHKARFSQEYHTKHHVITNKINDSRRSASTAMEEQEDGDHDDDDDDEEEELPLKQCSGPKKKLNGTMKSRGLRRKSFSPMCIPPTSSRWQQNQSWPASSASTPLTSSRWQPNQSWPASSSSSRSLDDTPFDMKNNPFTSPSLDTTNHVPTIKQQRPRDTAPREYCRSTSPQVRRRPSPTINNLLAEIECTRRLSPLCLDTTNHAPTSWPKQDAAFFVRDGGDMSEAHRHRRRGEDHHDHHVEDTTICSSFPGELSQECGASPSAERAAGGPVQYQSRYHCKDVSPELFNVGASLTTPPPP